MQLDKIILNGFKSFADKTEFNINCPITAIVGPNGCGKSNVVDAIKWVLGNQSPKSLRSGQMADVIFGGSSSRKASAMAEVGLQFTGVTAMGLEGETLEICRRLYRSGDSEYLINNKVCRLKDIRELFMDTGVGVSAYSIIEQGQIDQLLQKSTVERRAIFEEAAGISKFKAHKKEALRKLERTEQNLLRLADIVGEVEKQLRSIKLQAGKARNYLVYSERLKELRVNYSLAEYHKIVVQSREKKEQLAVLQGRFGSVASDVARHDAALSELNDGILHSESEINRWDGALISARSRIEQQYERIDFLRSRLDELSRRQITAADQILKLTQQSSGLESDLKGCHKALAENEDLFEIRNGQLQDLTAAIGEINASCAHIEASLDDEKSGIIDIVRRTAQLHNEIQSMSTYRDNLNGQKNRLSGRASAAEAQLRDLLARKAQHRARQEDINKVIADLQESLEQKRVQMTAIDADQARVNEQFAEAKERRSGLASERKVLSDMEARRQGLSTTVRAILNEKQKQPDRRYDYIDGIVADVIGADSDYAAAVEAALEGMTDALVVNSTGRFLADSEMREKLASRVRVLCTDRLAPFVDRHDLSAYPSAKGRLVEFAGYDSAYAQLAWSLLGRVVLVDSMAAAIELSGALGAGYRYVTVAGEVFDGTNVISVGPVGKAEGLISRKSRLHHLDTELAATSQQITRIETQLRENNQQTQHLATLCKDLRTAVYEATTEKVNTESALRVIEQDVRRLTEEQPVIAGEIELLEEEISQSVQKEYTSKQKLTELETVNNERTARIEQLEAGIAEKRRIQHAKSAELTDLRVQIGQIAEQQKALRQRITSLQSQLQHGRMAIEAARNDLAGCDDQMVGTQRSILASTSRISLLFVEKEQAQAVSIEMHAKVRTLMQTKQETEHIFKQKRAEQSDIEQQMHAVQLDLSQLTVRDEDMISRVQEELQINIVEAYGSFEQSDTDWDAIRDEIADLRSKIDRLGNVNVDAIREQDDLEQRYEFLSTQVTDLTQSKGQLEQLIDRINRESQDKFQLTFEEVRANFQVLFRKLFGGGKADIFLEDANNVLECGIEIVARPPGKETRSISLLSGGEKTMTAIALLFAIFKSKPSPFCVLDEVDAALDEANNERFNLIVQEFKKSSQFVIITHSKRTMSIADALFGVTMQTQGVSKKISVQFEHGATEESDSAVA
ncbi:MAG: chromosome segregation protein SMC [Phycisphaerae bacterium]|nr:chromosome segregation protein SMC [Phycisphaerae bacterium]